LRQTPHIEPEGIMRIAAASVVCLVAAGTLTGDARAPRATRSTQASSVLTRFLSNTDGSLVSYQALRRLSAASRGGKMQASLTAQTSLDPQTGFRYEVSEESGSGMIRSKVLHAALEAERQAKQREQADRGAVTDANYTFTVADAPADEAGLVRVDIHPRRKDTMLIEGSIFLTSEDADLVRIEGSLVKRPSFWTRRVQIVRRYARIDGVRVPISMSSTADVLVAGRSTFSMDYQYASINGKPVGSGSDNR
jgi:hypothetical protein